MFNLHTYLLSYLQYPYTDSNIEWEFETYENQGLSPKTLNTNWQRNKRTSLKEPRYNLCVKMTTLPSWMTAVNTRS